MAYETHCFFILFACCWVSIFSQTPDTGTLLRQLSDSLNYCIKHRQEYINKKETRIRTIKHRLTNKPQDDWQRYEIYDQLSKEYQKFNVDSAIHYAEKKLELSTLHHKSTELTRSKIDLSLLCSMRGRYLEAEKSCKASTAVHWTRIYAPNTIAPTTSSGSIIPFPPETTPTLKTICTV